MFYFSRKPMRVEIVEKEKKESGLNILFNKLSSLVQAVLGASTILYVLGFICWMLYAYDNHLGMLPAIKEQYFIAGIIPVLILIAVVLLLKLLSWATKKLIAFRPGRIMRKIILIIKIVFIISTVLVFLGKNFPGSVRTIITVIMISSLAFMMIFDNDKLGIRGIFIFAQIYTILFGLWLFGFVVFKIFPGIPSEFGGPKQTLVQFDILGNQLSPQTFSLIHKPLAGDSIMLKKDSAIHNQPEIMRSDSLYLLFEGNEFVLIKRSPGPIDSTNKLIKLRKSLIQGIIQLK
jgi:hypothetical protein